MENGTLEIEFVGITFAVDLGHNVLVVVVTKSSGHLVVVHVRLRLSLSPFPEKVVIAKLGQI